MPGSTDPAVPLHARGVDRPELRSDPMDATTLPTDRLELYFILRAELKHLLVISHEVLMSSAGARDGAGILARAAHRFASTAQAFADADPAAPDESTQDGTDY